MKRLLLVLAVAMAANAHAGFVTGAIVGSAMSSGKSNTNEATLISSGVPGRDVITCRQDVSYADRCADVWLGNNRRESYTPAQYTTYMGYKTLHSVGVVFHQGSRYFAMEVSK